MRHTIRPAARGAVLSGQISETPVPQGEARLWWLGQMGFCLKLAGRTIYIDAYLTADPERTAPPVLAPEELCGADILVGTHDHSDHIDRPAWQAIAYASPKTIFVVPALLLPLLSEELDIPRERFVGIADGQEAIVDGISFRGIAAAHELLQPDPATGLHPCMSYHIQADGVSIFHGGDFCLYEGLLAKLGACGRLDTLILPINGRDAARLKRNCIGNITYQEAVDLTGALRPDLVIPGHYDMFEMNSEDPALFADYLSCKYGDIPCWIGRYGEMISITSQHN